MTGKPGDALSFYPGLVHSPAALSLWGAPIGATLIRITAFGPRLEQAALDETIRRTPGNCNGSHEHG